MRGETKKEHGVGAARGATGDRLLSWKPWGESVSRRSVSVWDADEMSSRMKIENGPFDLTTWRFICDLGKSYFDEVKETEG